MKIKNTWASLLLFIFVCLAVEAVGSYWTYQSVSTWYPKLLKPSWTPPAWVFGPVWSTLYLMIALSGWLIYQAKDTPNRSAALLFYALQLSFNLIWSFVFFSLQSPLLGLIDILFLCLLIILTIINAWSVRRIAGVLLIPYLIWVLYATSLNAGIWLLNG